jgi:low temperature requirement protein LtrA
VFVVAVAELAQELARDHSLAGFAIFAGLFLPVFIAWQGFTSTPTASTPTTSSLAR